MVIAKLTYKRSVTCSKPERDQETCCSIYWWLSPDFARMYCTALQTTITQQLYSSNDKYNSWYVKWLLLQWKAHKSQ